MMPDEIKVYIVTTSTRLVNTISLICGLVVVSIILITISLDKKVMNRVSIRISLAISIVNIIKATMIILATFFQVQGWICTITESVFRWISFSYLFLNVAIAVNLQMLVINGYKFQIYWEKYYWMLTFSGASILTLLPLVLINMGFGNLDSCRNTLKFTLEDFIWEWALYLIWIFIVIIYCASVTVWTIVKLNYRPNTSFDEKCPNYISDNYQSLRNNQEIKNFIYRIVLYCTIPFLTHCGYLIYVVYDFLYQSGNFYLLLLMNVSSGLPGLLGFIVFLFDPAFEKAWVVIRSNLFSDQSPTSKRSQNSAKENDEKEIDNKLNLNSSSKSFNSDSERNQVIILTTSSEIDTISEHPSKAKLIDNESSQANISKTISEKHPSLSSIQTGSIFIDFTDDYPSSTISYIDIATFVKYL